MAEASCDPPPSCFRRFMDFALCRRTIRGGSEYIMLKSSDDVEMAELEDFIKDNFDNMGISASDLSEIDRESEVTKHLLKLLPVYKRCVKRHTKLERLLANRCRPHLRTAAEIECQKSKRVTEALDIVILKLLVGEFAFSEDESVEKLLEKFSIDQSTLCEVGKIVRLIDMDRESSQRLLTEGDVFDVESDNIISELEAAPDVPASNPGEDGVGDDNPGWIRNVGQRAAADGADRRVRVTTV
nr:tegument protein UL51 [Mastomys natalensis cytomegalovirus 3]WEG69896.1 tegument protein UL51 [Mastomys natalensis cytomegalovirus 3]WEG70036.1 tegument protein UL51 [Mastomys natalensis cytomegalovirus 3]WEG70176.1 tegument protein UL51 [Mastomys natalensis cytomegalovirus 3]WEG70316.1 tegument protein UL51 [Mastomys natalensis cytomegalovirus 3]